MRETTIRKTITLMSTIAVLRFRSRRSSSEPMLLTGARKFARIGIGDLIGAAISGRSRARAAPRGDKPPTRAAGDALKRNRGRTPEPNREIQKAEPQHRRSCQVDDSGEAHQRRQGARDQQRDTGTDHELAGRITELILRRQQMDSGACVVLAYSRAIASVCGKLPEEHYREQDQRLGARSCRAPRPIPRPAAARRESRRRGCIRDETRLSGV